MKTTKQILCLLCSLVCACGLSAQTITGKLTDEQKTAIDEAKAALDLARQKLDDWVASEPEPSEENNALYESMRDEIERAKASFMDLLKSAP